MQNPLSSLLKLVTCAVLALGAFAQVQAADKADPTGSWTWTQPGRNGGPDRKSTLKLKADGDEDTSASGFGAPVTHEVLRPCVPLHCGSGRRLAA